MDVIDNTGGGFDRLYFVGITKERLGFSREGDDLLVLVDSDLTQSVRVTGHFLGGDASIDMINPYAGSAIEASELPGLLEPLPFTASQNVPLGMRYVNSSEDDSLAAGTDVADLSGATPLNNQLDQLVSAMASYNASSGTGSVTPQDEKDDQQLIVAESWQAMG
jgi:hypothetical protein